MFPDICIKILVKDTLQYSLNSQNRNEQNNKHVHNFSKANNLLSFPSLTYLHYLLEKQLHKKYNHRQGNKHINPEKWFNEYRNYKQ